MMLLLKLVVLRVSRLGGMMMVVLRLVVSRRRRQVLIRVLWLQLLNWVDGLMRWLVHEANGDARWRTQMSRLLVLVLLLAHVAGVAVVLMMLIADHLI